MANTQGQGKPILAELGVIQNITTAANGVYTAQIDQVATLAMVVNVTSGGATEYLVLPKASAEYIGRIIYIRVTSNGYELVTPNASGDTINQVDGDGTNQLDVAANTTLMCIQVTATAWLAIQVAAATITVVAPDND